MGRAHWMDSIAFSLGSGDTLFRTRYDEPGVVSILRLPDGGIQAKFLAIRLEQGLAVGQLLAADACTLAVAEGRTSLRPDSDWGMHIWNVCGTPRRLKTIAHQRPPRWVTSGDGRILAGGDQDGRAWIYSLPAGQLLASRPIGTNVVNIAVSYDGSRIATTDFDDTAVVWDWQADEIVGRAPAPTALHDITIAGDHLFGRTSESMLYAWKIAPKLGATRVFLERHLSSLASASSTDVALALTLGSENVLWRPSAGSMVQHYRARVRRGEISDDGERVLLMADHLSVFAGPEKKLDLAWPNEYEEMTDADGHLRRWMKAVHGGTFPDAVTVETFLPRNPTKGSTEGLRRTVYWSTTAPDNWGSGRTTHTSGDFSGATALRGDGREAALGLLDWVIRYDVDTGKQTGRIALGFLTNEGDLGRPPDAKMDAARQLIYDARGALWIQTESRQLWRWDQAGPKRIDGRRLLPVNKPAMLFEATNEPEMLDDGPSAVPRNYIVLAGKQAVERAVQVPGMIAAVSPDGAWVATTELGAGPAAIPVAGNVPGGVILRIVRTDTGKPAWSVRHVNAQVSRFASSADGTLLAVGDREGAVRVWRVSDGVEIARFSTRGGTSLLAFTQNNASILLGGSESPDDSDRPARSPRAGASPVHAGHPR